MLKYLFLGNLINKNDLSDYPQKSSDQVQQIVKQYATEGKQIFQQLCSSGYDKFEERQKIDNNNGHFFFTTTLNGIFYLAFTENGYPDRYIFELFDKIKNEGLNLLINEKGKLSSAGNDKLKSFFKNYQDSSQINNIALANLEIEGVKVEMKNNIKSLMANTQDLNVISYFKQALDQKGQKIKEGSVVFQKDAKELESITWWKNCKLTLIIVAIIITIILAIAIPLAVKGSGSSTNTSTNG